MKPARKKWPRRGGVGFTYVEALVAVGTLAVLIAAVMVIIKSSAQLVGVARVRAIATGLARDRLELAHAVPYEDLGVEGGIPNGILPADEWVTVGGQEFLIETDVVYIDDPDDGLAPGDVIPTDYKRVRTEVSWSGVLTSTPIVMWSDVAPKGLETMVGAGTLSLRVLNASGEPVSQATVSIIANSLSPPVAATQSSDIDGRVLLPGAPVCVECYQVTVTKPGYTTDRTYGTAEVVNPNKPHVSIIEAQVSEVTFAIDKPASLTLRAVRGAQFGYAPFAGVVFKLQGTKEIGRNAVDEPVYLYEANHVTSGGGGQVIVPNLEWDTYKIIMPTGSSVDFAGSLPFTPVVVTPDSSQLVNSVVVAATPDSLLVRVTDLSEQPVASASVTLSLSGTIEATKSAGVPGAPDWAQVHFPGLDSVNYDVFVYAGGYQEATASVTVSGDKLEVFKLDSL
ncbi:hypothetical protein A2W24_06495 [Microgenomates group bacterium RBG_16_45_19]|nr:MAG: hypothetical protein A2W24_06495 [Microgenomates group bacterium RBG_16_45_19]